jgi:hypothetical protein
MRARVTLLGDIPVEQSEDFEQEIGDPEVHKHGTEAGQEGLVSRHLPSI